MASADPPTTAALCEHCHERPRAKVTLGRHEHLLRFCSEACVLAHPAVPDDINALRRRATDAQRELKIHVTVMTNLPEAEVRAHANRFAAALAEAVGSRPVKANVTPIGKANDDRLRDHESHAHDHGPGGPVMA